MCICWRNLIFIKQIQSSSKSITIVTLFKITVRIIWWNMQSCSCSPCSWIPSRSWTDLVVCNCFDHKCWLLGPQGPHVLTWTHLCRPSVHLSARKSRSHILYMYMLCRQIYLLNHQDVPSNPWDTLEVCFDPMGSLRQTPRRLSWSPPQNRLPRDKLVN